MINDADILVIIPAKGRSTGVPGKNMRLLAGKPLIVYTIETAKKARKVNRILVSTDDPKIKEISEKCGAEVPFLRPEELAKDNTPGIDPIIHALNWLEEKENYRPEIVVLLQPTSPLRSGRDVDNAIDLFFEKKADAVVSVCLSETHPYWMKEVDNDGRMSAFINNETAKRQELPPIYQLNGAIYISKVPVLLEKRTFCPEKTFAYIMPRERSVDIDTQLDFEFAEFLMGRKN